MRIVHYDGIIYMKRVLTVLFLLTACGRYEPSSSTTTGGSALADRRAEKQAEYRSLADASTGWPSVEDCDGLLWAGLAAAGGEAVDLSVAEYSPGEMHRRPAPSCWNEAEGDVGSKSTISNDMLIGYLWALWVRQDLDGLKRLAAYGEANNWVMGSPIEMASRVVMKPNQIGMLYRAIYALSEGTVDDSYRHLPIVYAPVEMDYERHIQALGILLEGEISGSISNNAIERLKQLVEAEPENPLFQAALGRYTGDMRRATALLLRDDLAPPSYVRDEPAHALVAWLFAAMIAGAE